ncbi:MAG: HAD-IIB family hydrolase [Rhodospirillaceae bacterium]
MNAIRPIKEWSSADRRRLKGVFVDIDDTLTDGGRIAANVFRAMEYLRRKGFILVPITGRPAGWCDMIARTWPVDGVVGENGAFYFRYDDATRRMLRVYADPPKTRQANRERLQAIRAEVLSSVPGVAVAVDQAYREADLAIDFAEDVAGVGDDAIDRIVAIFEKHGATAKVSSIHVNGWFGSYDKLTMTKRFMRECYGVDLDADTAAYVFVGDSPNDAPMFGYFPNAVGVANLSEMQDRCAALPAWITAQARGDGFVELAQVLLEDR